MHKYGISARLTFSNSLIREEHLADTRCNKLCKLFESGAVPNANEMHTIQEADKSRAFQDNGEMRAVQNGIIVHSDLLLNYIKSKYPSFYFVSSTTKVITDFEQFKAELDREEFRYVVPDFRLNKQFDKKTMFASRPQLKGATAFPMP